MKVKKSSRKSSRKIDFLQKCHENSIFIPRTLYLVFSTSKHLINLAKKEFWKKKKNWRGLIEVEIWLFALIFPFPPIFSILMRKVLEEIIFDKNLQTSSFGVKETFKQVAGDVNKVTGL